MLVRAWFEGEVVVAPALGVDFDGDRRAWRLDTAFMPGDPLPLAHPLRPRVPSTRTLQRVQKTLQRHLHAAGFDGLVWQAGLGNPVAFDNFLLLEDGRFTLVDAESGVPALFPANPLRLLTFYLPRSVRHGRPLFDDVDVPRLRRYLDRHEAALRGAVGDEAVDGLGPDVEALERHQARWKGLGRRARREAYREVVGAPRSRRERLRQGVRQVGEEATEWLLTVADTLPALWRWGKGVDWRARWRGWWGFVSSRRGRADRARSYIEDRVSAWRDRGQLSEGDAEALRDAVRRAHEEGAYLTDFGTHLGLKVSFFLLEIVVITGLVGVGWLGPALLAVVLLMDGAIYRTAYTLWRGAASVFQGAPMPWMALIVGVLPGVGSLAFPAQMLWSAQERENAVARFVICDTLTSLGRKIPIWGGEDSLTEHLFNRLGARLAGLRSAPEPA